MNNIIDKLDDFLNEREPKEKYMIYISIIIILGLIYYFFNYKVLFKEVKEKENNIGYIKQGYNIKSYEKKLLITKNKFKNLNNQVTSIEENLKYIQNLIHSIKNVKLFVTDDDLFLFLKNAFSFSIQKSLFPSYTIDSKTNSSLKEYTLKIRGETSAKNFINFINLLRFFEKSNYIINIERVEFNVTKYPNRIISDFNSTVNIWSYK